MIAGPNGAGKTTFAREYLSADDRQFEFVNADEIAGGLAARDTSVSLDFDAARLMLRRIDQLVEAGADFVVETTLANLTYAQKIPSWRRRAGVSEQPPGHSVFPGALLAAGFREDPHRHHKERGRQ